MTWRTRGSSSAFGTDAHVGSSRRRVDGAARPRWRASAVWASAAILCGAMLYRSCGSMRESTTPASTAGSARPAPVRLQVSAADPAPVERAQAAGIPGVQPAPRVTASGSRPGHEPRVLEARVAGLVLDATGGVVAGARITARDPESGAELAIAEADRAGSFELYVESGSALLAGAAEGYSSALLRLQAPATDVRVILVPSARLSGTVVEASTGKPVAGAEVTAWNTSGASEPELRVISSAEGAFSFPALATGAYILKARAEGFAPAETSSAVALGDAVEDVVLELSTATVLRGTVLVSDEPCGGAAVLLEGEHTVSALAGPDGEVVLNELPPGEYEATVHCEAAVQHKERLRAAAGQTVTRRWQLDPGLSVRGVVQRADGTALPGAQVIVEPAPRAGLEGAATEPRPHTVRVCEADSSGAFTCAGLTPDEYEVGLIDVGQERRQTQRVVLTSASVDGVVIHAEPSGTLRVSINPDNGAATLPQLVATAESGGRSAAAVRDGNRFVFRELELGAYRVHYGAGDEQSVSAVLDRDAQVVDVEIPLPPSERLSGRVVDEHGEPVPDVWVRAHPAEAAPGMLGTSSGVLTDERGAFTLEAFRTGDLALSAAGAHGTGTLAPVPSGAAELVVRVERSNVASP